MVQERFLKTGTYNSGGFIVVRCRYNFDGGPENRIRDGQADSGENDLLLFNIKRSDNNL